MTTIITGKLLRDGAEFSFTPISNPANLVLTTTAENNIVYIESSTEIFNSDLPSVWAVAGANKMFAVAQISRFKVAITVQEMDGSPTNNISAFVEVKI